MRARSLRVLGSACVAALAVGLAAVQATAQQSNLSGNWIFDVTVDGNVTHPVITFTQDGQELSGRYTSATLGNHELTGLVEGDSFRFSFSAEIEGIPVNVTYTGTIESAERLTGSIDLGGFIDGTFTARPQPEPA
jgi:hypothetical protein